MLILGGGINGIGLMRELALQGVRCVLVDKADFAAGATSKSSRMIHGGLRYLEHREFSLVRESLHERNRLLANAPALRQPAEDQHPAVFARRRAAAVGADLLRLSGSACRARLAHHPAWA